MEKYKEMTVGQIVANSFANASIFEKYGIDFCCNGLDMLPDACAKVGIEVDTVIEDLNKPKNESSEVIDFKSWPLDLLCDYILKFHHRNIRTQGPQIMELLRKVCDVHSCSHPELLEVKELFERSLEDLENHLQKEEIMLFPHIYVMCESVSSGLPIRDFHCGSVEAPISVMMAEHQAEGDRYHRMEELTAGYQTPSDGCGSYRLLMAKLKAFNGALHQHIHLENNVVFPTAINIERDNL